MAFCRGAGFFAACQCYEKNSSNAVGSDREGESGREGVSFEELYRQIALNCFRYLDCKNFAEVDRLTIPEYRLLMEAVRLKQIDRDYRNHLQAYLNFVVQAKRPAGKGRQKAVYGRFERFYNYQNELNRASGSGEKKSRFAGLGQFLKKGE